MDFSGNVSEWAEISEGGDSGKREISQTSLDKFDRLMGDDKIQAQYWETREYQPKLTPDEREEKFTQLFEEGDFFGINPGSFGWKWSEAERSDSPVSGLESEPDNSEQRKQNSEYEFHGSIYETDDNGQTYKKNGELLPDQEYTVKGSAYKTDAHGNIIACDSRPVYTEDGSRNMKEQRESGGEERQDSDDGGHVIARILGGAEGNENLVPMRRTVNRGDYKKMENEIARSLQEGKEVVLHIDLQYEKDSGRPSDIRAEYTIDGKKMVCEFDNNENSTRLLNSLEGKISHEDYNRLNQEMKDMKADGIEGSITSVKTQYDENGNVVKVVAGVLDESTGEKSYKVYEPRKEAQL